MIRLNTHQNPCKHHGKRDGQNLHLPTAKVMFIFEITKKYNYLCRQIVFK
jgi:hypothetical protein